MIYNWPAVEVGVGLIACNVPSMSFRFVDTLNPQVRTVIAFATRTSASPAPTKASAAGTVHTHKEMRGVEVRPPRAVYNKYDRPEDSPDSMAKPILPQPEPISPLLEPLNPEVFGISEADSKPLPNPPSQQNLPSPGLPEMDGRPLSHV